MISSEAVKMDSVAGIDRTRRDGRIADAAFQPQVSRPLAVMNIYWLEAMVTAARETSVVDR